MARMLEKVGEACHVDLDRLLLPLAAGENDLIRVAQDWSVLGPVLDELDERETTPPSLVDVGAGTQDGDRAHGDHRLLDWIRDRRERVILLEGDDAELRMRNDLYRDDPAAFLVIERSAERIALYAVAGHRVDTGGKSSAEVADEVRVLLQRTWHESS